MAFRRAVWGAGLVLRRPIVSSLWHLRGVYSRTLGPRCSPTRECIAGSGRLSRNSRHRAVHAAGELRGRTVLGQGAAGSVGLGAVQLARYAGAHVIGTVRSPADEATAAKAGAHDVVITGQEFIPRVKSRAPQGVDHIVEVAFAANIETNVELLKMGGSIASYATDIATPKIPFWQMVFKNIRVFFLGSDDFPPQAKVAATRDLNGALEAGWPGFEIGERIPLPEIARAHELVEHPVRAGRVVVTV